MPKNEHRAARVLEHDRALYEATGDPGHLESAIVDICLNGWQLPVWLAAQICDRLDAERRHRPGQGQRSWIERWEQTQMDLERNRAVVAVRQRGVRGDKVWSEAADELAKAGHHAAPETIRDSCKRVRALMRTLRRAYVPGGQ